MGNKGSSRKNGLNKETIDFLVKNTKFSREMIKEWYTGFKIDCPSGQLTPDKFIAMYSQVFPRGNAEQFSKNAFRTFDTDNSGTIDFTEFLLALHITSAGNAEEKLRWAFRMYDVDGNGTIDRHEMRAVVEGVYKMLGSDGEGRAEEIFTKMDKDSDGAVSEGEFMEACASDKEMMKLLTPNVSTT